MTHESLHTSPTVSGRTTLPPSSTDPGSGISSRDPPQGGMTGGGTGGAGKGAALATPAPRPRTIRLRPAPITPSAARLHSFIGHLAISAAADSQQPYASLAASAPIR